jgi:surface protein
MESISSQDPTNDQSSAVQIKLPLDINGVYNFIVYWGDGKKDLITTYNQTQITHTYPKTGIYTVKIIGIIQGWGFPGAGDELKIIEVKQFGCLTLINNSIGGFWFLNCTNLSLSKTKDLPRFIGPVSMSGAFQQITSQINRANEWNINAVTSLNSTFRLATAFNASLNNWDTSNITDMSSCFDTNAVFNGDISAWNTSSVTNMNTMFSNATAFDQNIGKWNVSNCTNFGQFMAGKTPSTFSASNLDSIYNGWTNYKLGAGLSITFGTANYNLAVSSEGKALLTRASTTFGISSITNNGSGLCRVVTPTHGLTTGNKINISNKCFSGYSY